MSQPQHHITGQKIRKLSVIEQLYVTEEIIVSVALEASLHGNSQKSPIDLPLLRRACRLWAERFPLLSACVIDSKYVHIDLEKKTEEMANVQLIDVPSNESRKEYVARQCELELNSVKFKVKEEPLWKLKCVRGGNEEKDEDSNKKKLTFIYTRHHVIGDGKNSTILVEFLNILNVLLNQDGDEKNQTKDKLPKVVPCPKPVDDLLGEFKSINNESRDFPHFDELSRMPPALKQQKDTSLVRESKCNVDTLAIDSVTLRSLIAQMKKHEQTKGTSKLTGLMETIICLALRQTLLQENDGKAMARAVLAGNRQNTFDWSQNMPMQYYILTSIRDKVKVDPRQMGVFSFALDGRFSPIANENSNKTTTETTAGFSLKQIFTRGEEQSRVLHEQIAANEHVAHVVHAGAMIAELEAISYICDEMWMTHALSNLGIFENVKGLDTKNSQTQTLPISTTYTSTYNQLLLKADALYSFMPVREKKFCGLMFIGLCTVRGGDDGMAIAISANDKFYTREFVARLKHNVREMIEQLVKE